jgi:hypothetical protein
LKQNIIVISPLNETEKRQHTAFTDSLEAKAYLLEAEAALYRAEIALWKAFEDIAENSG